MFESRLLSLVLRLGTHCACFHGHWEALSAMCFKGNLSPPRLAAPCPRVCTMSVSDARPLTRLPGGRPCLCQGRLCSLMERPPSWNLWRCIPALLLPCGLLYSRLFSLHPCVSEIVPDIEKSTEPKKALAGGGVGLGGRAGKIISVGEGRGNGDSGGMSLPDPCILGQQRM